MRRCYPTLGAAVLALLALPSLALGQPLSSVPEEPELELRLIDAATGYSIEPAEVLVLSARNSRGDSPRAIPLMKKKTGRLALRLAEGDHSLILRSNSYVEMSIGVSIDNTTNVPINIFLTPLKGPEELESSFLKSLHSSDHTLVVGFIVDDETGAPVVGGSVSSEPSGAHTTTDERGFFLLHIPLTEPAVDTMSFATLSFEAPGYRTQHRLNVELWPNGDWIYRIRLQAGEGSQTLDEARHRQRPHLSEEKGENPNETTSPLGSPNLELEESDFAAKAAPAVAIPRTIRVGLSGSIDYRLLEDYCRFVLPAEWIPSWGNLASGLGMDSLRAGAVAVRTYAIGYIRSPTSDTYDICATTVCQAYDPSRASSNTNDAVNQTSGIVMLNSAGTITFKMTEYSAENNALGLGCGDGFSGNSPNCLSDPVCATTSRDGHGRGMCQYGSARWASGLFLSTLKPHPYGRKSWQGILTHYYPALQIAQGQPLASGDAVKVFGTGGIGLKVRECSGGGIGSGINCPQKGSRADGQTGMIVSGPQWITSDGRGHTWWRIAWDSDGLTGWSVENWLERTTPASDTNPPDTSITGGPSGTVSTSSATFTYTGSDNVTPTGSLQFAYRLDPLEPSFSAFSSQTSRAYSNLGNGTYTFYVKARDQAGNQDATPASRSFTVQTQTTDTVPPNTSITSGPSGTVTTGNVSFTYTGSDNVTPSGSLQFAYRLDPIESSFSAFSSQTSRSYSNLGNGSYTFFVKARDQAGNEDSTPASRSFTVQTQTTDTVPPNTSITSGPSGTVTTGNVSFTYTGSDNVTPSGSLQFAYRLEPIESSFSAFSSQTSRPYSNLANGAYTFHVKAMDQAGNQDSTPATQTFTISVAPPPTGNRAKAADFDGDGRSDWVVYRNGTWLYFGPCSHPLNQRGTLIDPICSPCAQAVCDIDSYCCDTEWDGVCVSEFTELCR